MGLYSAHKLRRGLIALSVAVPALYLLSTSIAITKGYYSTIERAELDMRNISAALSEHAVRTFNEVDTRLRGAIAEIERRGLAPTAGDERELHEILGSAIGNSPLADGIGIVSSDGWIRAEASAYPMAPIDNRDREYFSFLKSHDDHGMYIFHPVKARSSGRWTIHVARRVDNPDGSLKMIVSVGVDMAYSITSTAVCIWKTASCCLYDATAGSSSKHL